MHAYHWYLGAAALLLVAILPLPYGYYTFLRIAICILSGWSAYRLFAARQFHWSSVSALLLAILFNPLFPVFLPKDNWVVLDLIAAAYFVYLSWRGPKLFSAGN